mgnify:FL=1|tara:strand:+ start:93 stop:284 length:192 start_codon:yes stop_codon:yes gene_type:complete
MGKFKTIETQIDEIIRDSYMLSDFGTEQQFTSIIYAKCLDAKIDASYQDHVNKRISEVLYELD